MSNDTVSLFLAMLAVLALAFVVASAVVALVARTRGLGPGLASWRDAASDASLLLALGVAATCTLGSLYMSEVRHFVPCDLCWYQRIAMYPLAVILLVAAARRDPGVRWYAAPLAVIGAVISTYHYVLEWFPQLESGACGVGPPCTLVWFREFGFVSLPYLALSAFLLILAFLWIAARGRPGGLRPVPLGGPRV